MSSFHDDIRTAKRLFDKYSMFKDNPIAWTAWKMAFRFGMDHQQEISKTSVSGELPQNVTVDEIIDVLEKLILNSHSIGADGEPTAPILDIVDTWIKARDLLCRLRQ